MDKEKLIKEIEQEIIYLNSKIEDIHTKRSEEVQLEIAKSNMYLALSNLITLTPMSGF